MSVTTATGGCISAWVWGVPSDPGRGVLPQVHELRPGRQTWSSWDLLCSRGPTVGLTNKRPSYHLPCGVENLISYSHLSLFTYLETHTRCLCFKAISCGVYSAAYANAVIPCRILASVCSDRLRPQRLNQKAAGLSLSGSIASCTAQEDAADKSEQSIASRTLVPLNSLLLSLHLKPVLLVHP